MLVLLSFLPLILMIFWLIRVRFANAYEKRVPVVVGETELSLSAR
jgi:hypothetical protein